MPTNEINNITAISLVLILFMATLTKAQFRDTFPNNIKNDICLGEIKANVTGTAL
jgi:hypothetical protein